ncbi:hypothetical protein COT50_02675 [candidate division WWE3 bacterium CG08_land_8_20_14_0_20_41_10]|uniref:Uncharacterized protein n=1 Tax=candidate division WWE3 bacterium CG08_land_8_20_14_0_20_41_10 TaxID=1975085 RepID=A0A2H0XBR9_UNCKA|nr:MAG: hypothetical protein COT50_02675 [candidate division WWE3 bacterium CG08_land_8_20_14_0_20_41_10]
MILSHCEPVQNLHELLVRQDYKILWDSFCYKATHWTNMQLDSTFVQPGYIGRCNSTKQTKFSNCLLKVSKQSN